MSVSYYTRDSESKGSSAEEEDLYMNSHPPDKFTDIDLSEKTMPVAVDHISAERKIGVAGLIVIVVLLLISLFCHFVLLYRSSSLMTVVVDDKATVVESTTTALIGKIAKEKKNCQEVKSALDEVGIRPPSGVYEIVIKEKKLDVWCDMSDDGWTVFQKRGQFGNPKEYFNRRWYEYLTGFGNPAEEYWLGLEYIQALAAQGNATLMIDLKGFKGERKYATYGNFRLRGPLFNLTFTDYTGGNVADRLTTEHKGMPFSTSDSDHDFNGGSCAETYMSGWWFKSCAAANLNGRNFNSPSNAPSKQGIYWDADKYSYPVTLMKLRIAA